MARRTKTGAKSAAAPADRMIDAALALAAERGWRDLALADIADAAGLSLAEAYGAFRSKQAVLDGFARRIDATVLAEGAVGQDEGPARDRLFDVLMRRFDALQPHRPALAAILKDLPRDPPAACAAGWQLRRSMALMLEAARIDSSGLAGAVRVKGLTAVYLLSLRRFLADESADMARTMASLDGYLRRIEGLAERCSRVRPGRNRDAQAASDEQPGGQPA